MHQSAKFICNPQSRPTPMKSHHWGEGRYYNSPAHKLEAGQGLPAFRRDFDLPDGTARVVLTVTALGIFDVYINGRRVEGEELKPGWTDYNCRVFEFSYDVTALCEKESMLTATLAGGWWNGRICLGEYGWREPALAAEIAFYAADGTCFSRIVTDEAWQTVIGGRVLAADIYDGEYYDARLPDVHEFPGGYAWQKASLFDGKTPAIVPHVGEPIRQRPQFNQHPVSAVIYDKIVPNGTDFGEISPVSARQGKGCETATLRAGEHMVLDLAQELVGWPHIKVKAPRGAKIEVMVAEMLNDSGDKARGNDGPKGSLYMANYRTAKARAVYVASGNGEEEYHPTFTFYGFRYFCITADADVEILEVEGISVGSDLRETGYIETSHPMVNRFFENVKWGQRSNYLSVPTDCPQRDERLGWSGDTQMFCGAGTYNADARGFLRKWLGDARDGQRLSAGYYDVIPVIEHLSRSGGKKYGATAWGDAGIIVPYTLYLKYNDLETLAEHYASMEAYMAFLDENNGPLDRYGDWLAYEETPHEYLSLAYWAYDALLMKRMANVLRKTDRATHYGNLYETLKKRFCEQYVKGDTLALTTQTACLVALRFGLVEGKVRQNVIALLEKKIVKNDYTLSTGFIGTSILNQTLSLVGLDDLAYSLLLQTKDPSWLYSLYQGATTVWERWNSYTKEKGFGAVNMNSFNHYAYGAVVEWMYGAMAGIAPDPEAPGFRHFILSPRPDLRKTLPEGQERITWVKAEYDSAAGLIKSAWTLENDTVTYRFTVPAGTTARVELLCAKDGDFVELNGKTHPVTALFDENGGKKIVFELSEGDWTVR